MMTLRSLVLVPLLIALCQALAFAQPAPAGAPAAPQTAEGAAAANKTAGKPGAPVPGASRGAPQQPANPPTTSAAPAQQPSSVPQPASAPAAPAASSSNASAEAHTLRLRDLEARIDELKEEIRRSHARLSLLSETLLSGGLGGARADIVFRNDTSNAFRVVRVMVILDGAVQYKKQDDTGELSKQREIPVFSGPVPPGDHTLQIVVGLQGHGYGVFSYLKAFKPEVKLTRSFTVEEGKAIRLELIAWEQGGETTPLEQRPAIRVKEKLMDKREAELAETQ